MNQLQANPMYDQLTPFQRKLAQVSDKIDLLVGLEVGGKITADNAYREIKKLMKELRKIEKEEIKEE
jgi:hypothetical protein